MKNKKFTTFCLVGFLFGLFLLFVGFNLAQAQQTLPQGGESFETAVKIEPGSYKGSSIKSRETEYFYIADVKPGQEIKIKGTFTPETNLSAIATVDLYDENRTDLGVGCYESREGTMDIPCEVSWITNSDKETYKYYIKTGSDVWNITSYLLDVSLIDRYDVGSQTDAGDAVEKAMEVSSGEYKAYLSGKAGVDIKDFYEVAVNKGKTLTVKVTPSGEALMRVAVYDKDRKVLKDEYASNQGAIVTNSLPIAKSGDVFVGVICDRYCSEELVAYTLDITTEEVVKDLEEGVLPEVEEGALIGIEEGVPKGAGVKSQNWLLIGGIIILVLVIVILIILLIKKQKK